jgi:hypothetical protein
MTSPEVDQLLSMLRDPNRETHEIAAAAGVPREEAGRACRIVMGIGRAKPDDVATLPPPLALAVLRAAVAAGRADMVAAAANHPAKQVSKEGKRELYLLRTRGVAVPEGPRPSVTAPAPTPEPPVPCYASALDGRGERALWLGRSVPGKGIEVAQVVISDQKGITELHIGMMGRKEYRAFGRDVLARGGGMGVTELDRETAKSIVAAARALNDADRGPPPSGTDAWLSRLGPAAPLPDLGARFPPLPEADERAAVDAGGKLHELPLVRGWLADEEALRALAHRLDEISVSSLYVDERQRAEAVGHAIHDAATSHFDDARRALWASRLLTLADHLERGGDAGSAGLAAASARALRSGVPVAQIPFARLLVEKAFPPPAPPGHPEPPAADPGSLLVTPR